ncbi:MAG: recombinase [Oscillospiraceae bacterium]|nr:recombinase [Oscillospiraceae bacterium]
MAYTKDPKRQLMGAISKAKGKNFETRLDASFTYYKERGSAIVEKTPEPMRPVKPMGNGKFISYFEKKAQPDYKGTLNGGRTVLFEAKYTSTDRLEQSRVLPGQADYLDRHQALGARCFILAGFGSGEVYNVPWDVWKNMKEKFGRKYVTETDLEPYRVYVARNGTLLILG